MVTGECRQARIERPPKGANHADTRGGETARLCVEYLNPLKIQGEIMSDYQKVLSSLSDVKQSGDKAMAKCPAHDDGSSSLSIKHLDNGKVLIHCFAGCTGEEILSAAGLSWSDIYPEDGYKPLASKVTLEEIKSAQFLMELVPIWHAQGNFNPTPSDREAIYNAQATLNAAKARGLL